MRPRFRSPASALRASVLVLAGVVGLAGCAGQSVSDNGLAAMTPAQIVAAARAAATGAATVRMRGSILRDGKPMLLNVELVKDKGGQGRLSEEGRRLDVIHVDSAVYIKGSEAFYRHAVGRASAAIPQGRWLKASDASGDLAPLASLTTLRGLLGTALANHGGLSHAGTGVIDGRKAVAVTDAKAGGTLYVAAVGTPYPLELIKHGVSAGVIAFDKWNKPVTLSVPENPINLKQVQSGRR